MEVQVTYPARSCISQSAHANRANKSNGPTAEDLIASLAAEHHLHSHSLNFSAEKVHRRARAHRGHIECLKVVDHIRDRVEPFLYRERVLMVHCTKVACCLTRREEVGGILEPDREGVELGPGRDRS